MFTHTLQINGIDVGPVQPPPGGSLIPSLKQNVTTQGQPGSLRNQLHLSQMLEPVTILVAPPFDPAVIQWISDVAEEKYARRTLTITGFDPQQKTKATYDLNLALIDEVRLPAMQKGSKTKVSMSLRVVAEDAKIEREHLDRPPATRSARLWSADDFRLTIDGMSTDAAIIEKIDALTIKSGVKAFQRGPYGRSENEPTGLSHSHLVVTLPASRGESWKTWLADVMNGKMIPPRQGNLVYAGSGSGLEMSFTNLEPTELAAAASSIRVTMIFDRLRVAAA